MIDNLYYSSRGDVKTLLWINKMNYEKALLFITTIWTDPMDVHHFVIQRDTLVHWVVQHKKKKKKKT